MDKRPAFELVAQRVAQSRIPEPIVLPAPPPDTSIQDALESIGRQIAYKPVPELHVDVEGAVSTLLSGLAELHTEPPAGLVTLIDALDAICQKIAAIQMPELSIDLDQAMKSLVAGLAKLKTEHKPVDLGPVIKAIQGVTMTVNVPAPPVVEHKQEPIVFSIKRDSFGRISQVIATPQAE